MLRATLSAPAAGVPAPAGCPDASLLAAYAEQALSETEREALEGHASTCPRCQMVLTVMFDTGEPAAAAPAVRPARRRWWAAPALRWLSPLAAAALGVVLYVAVRPPAPGDTPIVTGQTPPAADVTLAERAPLQSEPEPAGKSQQPPPPVRVDAPAAASEVSPTPMPRVAAAPPAVTLGVSAEAVHTQAAARPAEAAAPAAAPVPAPPAAAKARVADVAPADAARNERAAANLAGQKSVLAVEPRLILPEDTLEAYWRASSMVVRVRVGDSRPPVLVPGIARPGSAPVQEPLVFTTCDVIEVFSRAAAVAPTGTLSVVQVGGDVEGAEATYRVPSSHWLPLQRGGDYVLFLVPAPREGVPDALAPVGGPNGIYRLESDRVIRGHGGAPPPAASAAAWLARLRQLAGTARR
jgi:hypothetical protein